MHVPEPIPSAMRGILRLEHQVPRLPVPSLNSTVQQILSALKPLLTPEEYDEVLHEASEFLVHDSVTLIQKHLQAASENPTVGCYLSAITGESYPGIYGDLRGDILPRNPYLVLEEDPYAMTINPPNQAQRMATLVNSTLKFIVTLRNGTLKPDFTPKSHKPLTMNCYRNLFGTTRVPEKYHSVTIKKYPHFNDSRHVVFICNNQFYSLEVLSECNDESAKSLHELWFADADLASIVQWILDDASSVDRVASVNNGIGSITTQSYGVWANARFELQKSCGSCLEMIDNALFIAVLDNTVSPVTDQEKTMAISHGTSKLAEGTNIQVGSCTSRWYDKLQLVVTANAVAGVVWESSLMDSTAILRFISDIYTDSILKLAKNINGAESTLFDQNIKFASDKEHPSKPSVVRLIFTKSPELSNLVHLSETRLADLLNQHEFKTLTMKLDSHLLSKFSISTDSLLQVGFQIAYYALYGKVVNTLEPITTRKFKDARTELIAVQNEPIADLVRLFVTSSENSKKWEAIRACCAKHTTQYRDAMVGKGFERHLFALYQIFSKPNAIQNLNSVNKNSGLPPIPDLEDLLATDIPLLSGHMFEKLSNAELLISNCGNPALRLFGISPAIEQGFGIGYIIHKDKIVVTVSSKHRQTQRFVDTFNSVMSDIKHIISAEADLMLESADTEIRRKEFKNLRIQAELSRVNNNLSSTKHPIDITLNIGPEASSMDFEASNKDKDSEQEDEDYHYLGGYGYFDVDQVAMRSDQISRVQSYLNSPSHYASAHSSNVGSRSHSHFNLSSLSKKMSHANDVKERFSLSEKIRDKLSTSANNSSLDLGAQEDNDPAKESRPKQEVGRSIDTV